MAVPSYPVVDGEIHAVGRVTEQGERRILAEAELFNSDGVLVGRGAGSFARSQIALTPAVHYA